MDYFNPLTHRASVEKIELFNWFINDANNQHIEITECILGSIINQNPATTATLTNEQVTSQQNFILQQLGRGAQQLIEQIVMNSFHILRQKGIIHETIRNFLLDNSNRLPYFLLWVKQWSI